MDMSHHVSRLDVKKERGGPRRDVSSSGCFARELLGALTREAETSWAVDAAMSCPHTITSSNLARPSTASPAVSLEAQKEEKKGADKRSTVVWPVPSRMATHTRDPAPAPTAFAAETRPSTQRECFL